MISTSSSILYKDFATPRIVAFNAWQSPPLVKIPILLILRSSISECQTLHTGRVGTDTQEWLYYTHFVIIAQREYWGKCKIKTKKA